MSESLTPREIAIVRAISEAMDQDKAGKGLQGWGLIKQRAERLLCNEPEIKRGDIVELRGERGDYVALGERSDGMVRVALAGSVADFPRDRVRLILRDRVRLILRASYSEVES